MRKLEMKATPDFSGAKRVLFFLAIIFNIIYVVWRLFFTIPFGYAIWEVVFGLLLFAVELGGMFEMFSHFFRNEQVR